MESAIAKALDLEYGPVAVLLTDKKPEKALEFKPGRWGCVMFMFANAARGKTAVFDKTTYGCWGGGVGLGFGNAYEQFPGGVPCFTHFLSSGNRQWETGRQVGEVLAEKAGREFADNFLNGEAYVKSPDLVEKFLKALPIMDHGSSYVMFRPLDEIEPAGKRPETVVFVANPDQVSALVVLANYGRGGMDNVIIPWAAGCQTIGIIPFEEARSDRPRAVVGLTDISARKYVRPLLGDHVLTVAVPWKLFCEMEENVPGSFLERHVWLSLVEKK
ncbi:MAG: DUF169 domain-containing protein [Thermodesulfobacteriota bacterium]